MGITHKFKEYDFQKGFKTKNAILVDTPYDPEILFLGTFNPLTDETNNMADFFYGRNWFWSIIFNIFHYKNIFLDKQRKFYSPDLEPSLDDILDFMKVHKITFADLIVQVLDEGDDFCLAKNKIIYNKNFYDLINDGDLSKLNNINKIKWNQNELMNYIKNKESIKSIYFTRKPSKPFSDILNNIDNTFKDRNLKVKYLFTPSGQGMKGVPRINALVSQWKNSQIKGFDSLDNEWLKNYEQL